MLSTIAIVIAGISLTCAIVTFYRNLPFEPTIKELEKIKKEQSQEIVVSDNEINIIL